MTFTEHAEFTQLFLHSLRLHSGPTGSQFAVVKSQFTLTFWDEIPLLLFFFFGFSEQSDEMVVNIFNVDYTLTQSCLNHFKFTKMSWPKVVKAMCTLSALEAIVNSII